MLSCAVLCRAAWCLLLQLLLYVYTYVVRILLGSRENVELNHFFQFLDTAVALMYLEYGGIGRACRQRRCCCGMIAAGSQYTEKLAVLVLCVGV